METGRISAMLVEGRIDQMNQRWVELNWKLSFTLVYVSVYLLDIVRNIFNKISRKSRKYFG